MNILILGQGGREHALAWKISQSPHCTALYVAPGNGGTKEVAQNIDLDIFDFEAVYQTVNALGIDMVVIGPEAPLAKGIVDYLEEKVPKVHVIGPNQQGAQLEASKAFAKKFMIRHNIPTADYAVIGQGQFDEGKNYIDRMKIPIVLKADGLAAGKGVVICNTKEEAYQTLGSMLEGEFGEASENVVIEEFLSGREYSVFALTDGNEYYLLPEAKDYKRIGEGDNGPNTGGMGCVSPVSYVDSSLMQKTISKVILPTLTGLNKDGITYSGFIFFGLIEVSGEPMVIEYNCRLGDPETEVVLPRIDSDLVEHFIDVCTHAIDPLKMKISDQACATVMMVSGGYPGQYDKGKVIQGLDQIQDCMLFHAGTIEREGQIRTNGGRVIAVTSMDSNTQKAISKSYNQLKQIYFDKQYYRTDIGFDL